MAGQQAHAEHDAARQAEPRAAMNVLLQGLKLRHRGDLPTSIIVAPEDAERVCRGLAEIRPDTMLTVALNWLLEEARLFGTAACGSGRPAAGQLSVRRTGVANATRGRRARQIGARGRVVTIRSRPIRA